MGPEQVGPTPSGVPAFHPGRVSPGRGGAGGRLGFRYGAAGELGPYQSRLSARPSGSRMREASVQSWWSKSVSGSRSSRIYKAAQQLVLAGRGLPPDPLGRPAGVDALGGIDADVADRHRVAAEADDEGVSIDHPHDRAGLRDAIWALLSSILPQIVSASLRSLRRLFSCSAAGPSRGKRVGWRRLLVSRSGERKYGVGGDPGLVRQRSVHASCGGPRPRSCTTACRGRSRPGRRARGRRPGGKSGCRSDRRRTAAEAVTGQGVDVLLDPERRDRRPEHDGVGQSGRRGRRLIPRVRGTDQHALRLAAERLIHGEDPTAGDHGRIAVECLAATMRRDGSRTVTV